jgi:endonuclease/exonuclease/phosphatase family metal-dependent hydrolase
MFKVPFAKKNINIISWNLWAFDTYNGFGIKSEPLDQWKERVRRQKAAIDNYNKDKEKTIVCLQEFTGTEKSQEAGDFMQNVFDTASLDLHFHNQTIAPRSPKFTPPQPQRVVVQSEEKNQKGKPYCTHRYLISAERIGDNVVVVANVHLGSYPEDRRTTYVPKIISHVIDNVNNYIRTNKIRSSLKVMIGDFNCDLETIRDQLKSSGKVLRFMAIKSGTQSLDKSGTSRLETTDGCIVLA